MIRKYFKPIWKNIWKNKFVSFINLAGLSIGMTCAVFIFLWAQNESTFDTYHPRSKDIYSVTTEIPGIKWVFETSPLLLADLAPKEIPGVEKATRIMPYYGNLTVNINDQLFVEKKAAYVDKEWFNLFHYDFVEGNALSFATNPFSVIMTESKAKKYFGSMDAAGRTIRIDTNDYKVQAVIKDIPPNSTFQFDVLIPVDAYLSNPRNRKNDESWNNLNYGTFFLLDANANPTAVSKSTSVLIQKHEKNAEDIVHLLPLQKLHFETSFTSSQFQHTNPKTVYIFTMLGFILLLIACINYVNLTTARATVRSKEVSVRKILGADRRNLFNQFMAESFLITLLSMVLTLVMVKLCMPWFNDVTGKNLQLPITAPTLWQVMGGTLLLATLLNGIYPALVLSSFKPLNIFRGISTLNMKNTSLRKTLVTVQFTLSVALVIATIVVSRQLNFLQHADIGFNHSMIFSFGVPYKAIMKYNQQAKDNFFGPFKQELLSQSAIQEVTTANQSILNLTSTNSGSADWDGHDTSFTPTVSQLSADTDFKKVFELRMKEGRWFLPASKADEHNFILNETAVDLFNIHKPVLGQRFSFQGDTGQIIGIVKDFHYKSMRDKIGPLVVFNKSGWRSIFFIKASAANITDAVQAAERTWKKFVPGEAFDYVFLDESFNNLYKSEKRISLLILLFSSVAILVSALGLFALTVFTTHQRTKEIGIRKVLGASLYNIVTLIATDFIRLILIASVMAIPIAWWAMNQWLNDFAYRINIGWWIFFVAALLSLIVALVTIAVEAIRASVANPVKSLRNE
jgi:putative ABC transport system permease protein